MVAGVVLAAGEGQRIGVPKALLETGTPGESFVARACRCLRDGGVDQVVVVTSVPLGERVRVLAGGADVIENPRPSRGQLSSLQAALSLFADAWPQAVVALPVDVPLVRSETVRALLDVWRRSGAPVVRPVQDQAHGHPVVFDRRLLPELLTLEPERGAKALVRQHASPGGEVTVADEGAFLDIDTVEDYRRVFGRLPQQVHVR